MAPLSSLLLPVTVLAVAAGSSSSVAAHPHHRNRGTTLGARHDHSFRARAWRDAHPQLAAAFEPRAPAASKSASAAGAEQSTPTKTTCPRMNVPAGLSDILAKFPKPSGVASIVAGDSTAQALFQEITTYSDYSAAFAIAPKGTNDGDFSSLHYDEHADTDCWWTTTRCNRPKVEYVETDTYRCAEGNTWGLTFDDGPFCDNADFYAFLRQNKLKATMFYVGINVYNNPVQAQLGVTEGHELCSHTWSHKYMTSLTNEQLFAELYYTKKLIKDVTGVTVQCWRPPFGDMDDRVRTMAHALGMRTISWSHDTFDWTVFQEVAGKRVGVDEIKQNYQYIYGNASASQGEIVLSHEINADTIKMFMEEYPSLSAAYQHVVPVGACMNITHPYVEGEITFPDFQTFIAGNIAASPAVTPSVSNADISILSENPQSTGGKPGSASKTGSGNSAAASGTKDDSAAPRSASAALTGLAAAVVAALAGAAVL